MSNFVSRLKLFPWKELLQIAAVSIIGFVVLDISVTIAIVNSTGIEPVLKLLLPSFAVLVNQTAGLGLGVLAVAILERFYRQRVYITAGSLWALFFCLLLGLLIVYSLPIPGLIIRGIGQIPLLGLVLGIFWKGRPYCRSASGYRRF
jgi:hypothetical protein